MAGKRRRLAVLAHDLHAHRAQARALGERRAEIARLLAPCEAAAQTRMQLVVQRRVDVRSDPLVETLGAVTAEQQVVTRERRAAHAELLAAVGDSHAVRLAQA